MKKKDKLKKEFKIDKSKFYKKNLSYSRSNIQDNIDTDFLSSIAIEIWRLEKKLNKEKQLVKKKSSTNSYTVFDQLQRIKDILVRYNIEIRDMTNENYDDCMAVKVLSFEKDKDLSPGEKKIKETLKPSIYYKNKIISKGKVIVVESTK